MQRILSVRICIKNLSFSINVSFQKNSLSKLSVMLSSSEEENVIQMPDISVQFDKRGLGYVYFHAMKRFRNKIAQINGITGEKQSYAEILKLSVRVAIHMRNLGVTQSDVISTCSYNQMETCVPFISAMFLGAKFSGLDPRLSTTFAQSLIEQTKPKLIFADKSGIELLEKSNVRANIVSFDSSQRYVHFDDFIEPTDGEDTFAPFEVEDEMQTAVIHFTSGTTGSPKGICISHYALLRQSYMFLCVFLSNQEVVLHLSTLYWISGSLTLTGLITNGYCKVIFKIFDLTTVWHLIEKHKATLLMTTTAEAIAMYKAGRPRSVDISSLKKIGFGGSSMPQEILIKLREMLPGVHINPAYGQTEACGGVTCFDSNNPEDLELSNKKPLSCGKPLEGFWYKVVDIESERALGPYQQGEIRTKSKLNFNTYYKKSATDAYDSAGWLKMGDLAYYDEDNCFYIVDRLKEVFIYRDWFIAPSMIESVLQTHPAVEKCIVVPVPHEDDISRALGVVVLQESSLNVSEEELIMYVEKRMEPRYYLTAGVKIIESIPMTPTGKINRRYVKEMVLNGEI